VSDLGTEAKPIWFELAVQEYNALRGEILATMATQDGTLRFGAATVGIVLTGGFSVWDDRLPAALIFLVVVPFLCLMVLIVWLGEVTRMMRAGNHVLELEDMFLENIPGLPEPVMRWEKNLRDPTAKGTRWKRHYEWNYLAIVLMFWSLGVVSIAGGVYRVIWAKGSPSNPTVVWNAAGILLGLMVIGLFLTLRKLATVCETAGWLRCLKKMYLAELRKWWTGSAREQDESA
jgi:hypothetical protein